MKLSAWLALPNSDGSRKRRNAFAVAIGVTPSMVTEYCEGRMWPKRDIMEAIYRETNGAVTANDFLRVENLAPAGAAA